MRYSSPDRKARPPPPPFWTWIYQLKGVFLFCSRMCCAYFFPMFIHTFELKKKRKKTKISIYLYIMNKVYIHSKGAGEGDKIWKRDQKATAAIADSLLLKKERPTTQLLSPPPLPLHIFILNGNNDELWGALWKRGKSFFFFQPTRRKKEKKNEREW